MMKNKKMMVMGEEGDAEAGVWSSPGNRSR